MDTTTYGQLSANRSISATSESGAPLEAAIESHAAAPLECLQCYNNLPMGDLAARNRELTKESTSGCSTILRTWGHSGSSTAAAKFLPARISRDLHYAKEKGFLITLFTNGILINEKDCRLSGRVAAVRHRDHPLRPHQRDLRSAHRHRRAPTTAACAASRICGNASFP